MVGQCEVCVRIDHPVGNDMFSGGREGGSEVSGHRDIERYSSGDQKCENHNQVRYVHTFTFTSCFTFVIHIQTINVESMYTMFHGGGEQSDSEW